MGKKRKIESKEEMNVNIESDDNISSKTKKKKKNKQESEDSSSQIESSIEQILLNDKLCEGDVNATWTEEEMYILISKVDKYIPDGSHYRRFAKINWEKIKFEPYTAEDCKHKFNEILYFQRTFRFCNEILQDMRSWVKQPWLSNAKKKIHPEMPSKPKSVYNLFAADKIKKIHKKNPTLSIGELSKLVGEMFKSLPEEKLNKYKENYLEMKKDYDDKLKAFYELHPEYKPVQQNRANKKEGPVRPLPPFKLFCQSKVEKHKNDPDFDAKKNVNRCKQLWKKMSDKKKVVWIKWALEKEKEYLVELKKYISEHPEFDATKAKTSILTKEEKTVLDRVAGKPDSIPSSAYQLFFKVSMKDNYGEDAKNKMKELAETWNNLNDEEKQKYYDELAKLKDEYKIKYSEYINSLPEEERLIELQKNRIQNKGKSKKKPEAVKDMNQTKISDWIKKKTEDIVKEQEEILLFKNEPAPPPKNLYDYFVMKFKEKYSDKPIEKVLEKAKFKWTVMSNEKKNKLNSEFESLKKQFIKEYALFLKNLNEKEVAEYSMYKNQRLKNSSNGKDDTNSSFEDSSGNSEDSEDDTTKKAPEQQNHDSSSEDDSN